MIPSTLCTHTDLGSIGTLYNVVYGQERRDNIASWAKAKYPEVWDRLQAVGMEAVSEGLDHQYEAFRIDRKVSS